jgi:hypothetical protein
MVSSKYASLISSIHWMHRCIGLVLYITGICNGYLGICDITIGFYSAVYLPKLYITSAVLFPTALLINGWCKLREQQHHDNSKESHIETHNFNSMWDFFIILNLFLFQFFQVFLGMKLMTGFAVDINGL